MHTRIRSLTFLAALAAVLSHAQARADVPPPDICDTEGAACDNAGPDADQPGTCESAQCSRPEPKPDGGVIVYDCLRCVPPGGGAGGDAGVREAHAGIGGEDGRHRRARGDVEVEGLGDGGSRDREQEDQRRQWRDQQAAQVADARKRSETLVTEARSQIAGEAAQARQTLAGETQLLADRITRSILQGRAA